MGFCCSDPNSEGGGGIMSVASTPNFKVNSSVVNQEDVNKSTALQMCEKRMMMAEN